MAPSSEHNFTLDAINENDDQGPPTEEAEDSAVDESTTQQSVDTSEKDTGEKKRPRLLKALSKMFGVERRVLKISRLMLVKKGTKKEIRMETVP